MTEITPPNSRDSSSAAIGGSYTCRSCGSVVAWEGERPEDCIRCGARLKRTHPWPPPSKKQHASDCAVHNEPALPAGPCDCGAHNQTSETSTCICGHPRSSHADCGRGPCRTNVSIALWHDSDDRKVTGCRCPSYYELVETREVEANG